MASKKYITTLTIKDQVEHFTESLPESYLLAVALIAGCKAGLKNAKMPIHILGLGSPIVIVDWVLAEKVPAD